MYVHTGKHTKTLKLTYHSCTLLKGSNLAGVWEICNAMKQAFVVV